MPAHSAQGQSRRAEGTGLPGSRPDASPLADQDPLWKATPPPTDPSPRMALVTAAPSAPRPRGGFQRGCCGLGALPTPLYGPNSPGSACGGHLLPATSRMRTIQPEYPSMTLTHMRSPRGTEAGNGKSRDLQTSMKEGLSEVLGQFVIKSRQNPSALKLTLSCKTVK